MKELAVAVLLMLIVWLGLSAIFHALRAVESEQGKEGDDGP
jgi:hypothetical protein